MGVITEESTGHSSALEAHHLVGRSHRSSLRLNDRSVSGEHASLRWTGGAWVVKDLGSRYGTYLNAQPLQAGVPATLAPGDRLAFGREKSTWILVDAAAPEVMLMPVGGGPAVTMAGGLIAIPGPETPTAVVFQGRDGTWLLDQGGREEAINEHVPFAVDGAQWWLCNASPLSPTAMPGEGRETMSLDEVQLRFLVSSNEEHVEVSTRWRDRTVDLGARSHHYVLLTLARIRLEDTHRGEAAGRAGWIDQEELLRRLQVSPDRLNLDVFRARRQFGEHGFTPAAGIVERRPAAKELRIGVGELQVERA
jgi:hypothetical protein